MGNIVNDIDISLSTFLESSKSFGLSLLDFSKIRNNQQSEIYNEIQLKSSSELNNPNHKKYYLYGTMDFLVSEENGSNRFHFMEFNGSTVGHYTALPFSVLSTILNELSDMCSFIKDDPPLIVYPKRVIMSKLIHERLLLTEYFKKGLIKHFGEGQTILTSDILENKFIPQKPTVVMGHLNDFLKILNYDSQSGILKLYDNKVSMCNFDYLVQRIIEQFNIPDYKYSFLPINGDPYLGTSKYYQYQMINSFLKDNPAENIIKEVNFTIANNREELIESICQQLDHGKKLVIKPSGSAIGRGIEFFLNNESKDNIIEKIDKSIQDATSLFENNNLIFPYTICEFINTKTIKKTNHPKLGHKFELRIYIYRDGKTIKAFPSEVKVAPKPYQDDGDTRLMLINTVSIATSLNLGVLEDFLLPLSNAQTLEALGISLEELSELSSVTVKFIKYVIEHTSTLY